MAPSRFSNRDLRRRHFGAMSLDGGLALIALLALLATASATPESHRASAVQQSLTIAATSSQINASRFDSDGLQWNAPVNVCLSYLPRAEFVHSSLVAYVPSGLEIEGFCYNRPPPAA
jgi:hypothetical protein